MALVKTRRIAGWVPTFLHHIKNGKNEKVAANLAQVGTGVVHATMKKDPRFLADYQDAFDKRRQNPAGG